MIALASWASAYAQTPASPFVQHAPATPPPSVATSQPVLPASTTGHPAAIELTTTTTGAVTLYNLKAEGQDVIGVLSALADAAHESIAFVGNVAGTVTVTIRRSSFDDAVNLIARAAGIAAERQSAGWLVGSRSDIAAAVAPQPVSPGTSRIAVYQCEHLNATTLVATLQAAFDPQLVKIVLGPSYLSPTLTAGASNEAVTNEQGSTVATLGESDVNLRTHQVIFIGDPATVEKAIVLARKLDHHRAQVKINVRITDVSVDALRQLGVQWDFGTYSLVEVPTATAGTGPAPVVPGIKFGKFAHTPLDISATISALETRGDAKLLAEPSMAVLDGERSFILIGQRELFPKLVSSYYGAPTYDVQEVRVGVYIQVAVQIGQDDDIVLTIYPQVSLITDRLTINGGVYPIIDTREQQTTVRVKNRQMIAIGGLIRDDDLKNFERVPLLGHIPIFGELFKYRSRSHVKSELVIMLTPVIEEPPPTE